MERLKEALNKARIERNNPMSRGGYSDFLGDNTDGFNIGSRHEQGLYEQVKRPLLYPIQYHESVLHQVNTKFLKKQRIITENDNSAVARAYNLLRTKVLQKLERNNWNSIAVVSANRGEGKTLTAINLAISIARDIKYTALLADFDLLNPSIHKCFDYFPEYALEDYLWNHIGLNKILMNPDIESLLILPGKHEIKNSAETLASPIVENLVSDLNNYYQSRIVIYDLPPLLEADDALSFSSCYDAVILVVEDGKTTADDLNRLSELLANKPVLGTVLNKSFY